MCTSPHTDTKLKDNNCHTREVFGDKSTLEGVLAVFLRGRRALTWLAMFMSFWTVSENLAALVAPDLKKLSLSRVLVCLTWLALIREEGYSLRFGWGQETLPVCLRTFLGSGGRRGLSFVQEGTRVAPCHLDLTEQLWGSDTGNDTCGIQITRILKNTSSKVHVFRLGSPGRHYWDALSSPIFPLWVGGPQPLLLPLFCFLWLTIPKLGAQVTRSSCKFPIWALWLQQGKANDRNNNNKKTYNSKEVDKQQAWWVQARQFQLLGKLKQEVCKLEACLGHKQVLGQPEPLHKMLSKMK